MKAWNDPSFDGTYFDDPGWVDDSPICPACGAVVDYCQGHGTIGDPIGAAILAAHDEDDHGMCHDAADCHNA